MNLEPITLVLDKNNSLYSSPECQQLLTMYEDFYPKIGYNVPWVGYFVISNNHVVGSCGFVGQPLDGIVEIAYWTFQEYEGQGIASFACKQLIDFAQASDPNIIITAKTAPEHNASTRILENNGFVFTKIVQDEEIGNAWFWVLHGAKR